MFILIGRTNEEELVLISRTNVSNRNHGQKNERKIDMYIQIDYPVLAGEDAKPWQLQ